MSSRKCGYLLDPEALNAMFLLEIKVSFLFQISRFSHDCGILQYLCMFALSFFPFAFNYQIFLYVSFIES